MAGESREAARLRGVEFRRAILCCDCEMISDCGRAARCESCGSASTIWLSRALARKHGTELRSAVLCCACEMIGPAKDGDRCAECGSRSTLALDAVVRAIGQSALEYMEEAASA